MTQWYHPELPWQSSEIAVTPCFVTEDTRYRLSLGPAIIVVGKHGSIAAQDPGWASNNTLFFLPATSSKPVEIRLRRFLRYCKASPIFTEPVEEEFGGLQWWLTGHWSGALNCTTVAFLSFRQAHSTLYVCDLAKGTYAEVPTPYAQIQYMHGDGRSKVAMLGQPADSDGVITELVLGESDRPHLRPIAGPGTKQPPGLLPRPLIVFPQCYALQLALRTEFAILHTIFRRTWITMEAFQENNRQ